MTEHASGVLLGTDLFPASHHINEDRTQEKKAARPKACICTGAQHTQLKTYVI